MSKFLDQDLSRRKFLYGTGITLGGAMAAGALSACTPSSNAQTSAAEASSGSETARVQTEGTTGAQLPEELKVVAGSAPSTTDYTCDVLVIGCGYAGLNAAMAAKEAGADVLVIDKGHPGYSGLSPWPSSHRWFDESMGDRADDYVYAMQSGGEWVQNKTTFQLWLDQSKETYERLTEWGLMDRYDRFADTEYWNNLDFVGYTEAMRANDRHARVAALLDEKGIPYVDHTMINEVILEEGRAVGAVGLHVTSGAIITINAKSIVMAMGGGSYKPSGFPTGTNTFDGEYIAYNLGLPICGKEYDDSHGTSSFAPGSVFITTYSDWMENLWLCGGDITADNYQSYGAEKAQAMCISRVTGAQTGKAVFDGTTVDDQANGTVSRRGGSVSESPDDPRTGKMCSPKAKGDLPGGAIGMCLHLCSGVLNDLDDVVGATSISGLYVAGDGMHASNVGGAMYPNGVGFTSNYTSIEGWQAGSAAAEFAGSAELVSLPSDKVDAARAEIEAPLSVESGFSPDWARDQLYAIMSPYWIMETKSEESLSAALVQVEFLRDEVVPKLVAADSHTQRLCLEAKHKILSAEMKLRAALERKESRGFHYRSDYPYRDDNYLCYITLTKGEDGSMQVGRVEVKDEWKGDVSEDYATRYPARFPGEAEAKGLPVEESSGGWGSGR